MLFTIYIDDSFLKNLHYFARVPFLLLDLASNLIGTVLGIIKILKVYNRFKGYIRKLDNEI